LFVSCFWGIASGGAHMEGPDLELAFSMGRLLLTALPVADRLRQSRQARRATHYSLLAFTRSRLGSGLLDQRVHAGLLGSGSPSSS